MNMDRRTAAALDRWLTTDPRDSQQDSENEDSENEDQEWEEYDPACNRCGHPYSDHPSVPTYDHAMEEWYDRTICPPSNQGSA